MLSWVKYTKYALTKGSYFSQKDLKCKIFFDMLLFTQQEQICDFIYIRSLLINPKTPK